MGKPHKKDRQILEQTKPEFKFVTFVCFVILFIPDGTSGVEGISFTCLRKSVASVPRRGCTMLQSVACVSRKVGTVSGLCPEEKGCSQWLVSRGEGCTVVLQSVACVPRRKCAVSGLCPEERGGRCCSQ